MDSRPDRRELRLVALAVVAGLALRIAYIVATRGHQIVNDEVEYYNEGTLASVGKLLWSTNPWGEVHASAFKTPGYAAWLGLVFKVFGVGVDRALVVQTVVWSSLTIVLSWLLARRLFGRGVAIATLAVVAVYPNVWQFDVRLFSEPIAIPLTLLVFLLVLPVAGRVTWRRAVGVGALLGVLLLVRSSSLFLLAPIGVIWWARSGARLGTAQLVATILAMAAVVSPWTLRNHHLFPDHLIPLSLQSAAAYGVFNDDAANDAAYRWGWRPVPTRDRDLYQTARSEGAMYAELMRRTRAYIRAHPETVPKAFLANGVRRLWDFRRPRETLGEVPFEGRTRVVAAVGLYMYWPLLLAALAGLLTLWRTGRRPLVIALLATALGASVVFTSDAMTRYRAPFEPVIVMLAMSVLVALPAKWRGVDSATDADPACR